MKTQGTTGKTAVRKYSVRAIALSVGGLIVAGMVTSAAAYWQVHDRASYQVLQEIKRETEKTKDNVKAFDDQTRPKFDKTSNGSRYNPYKARSNATKFSYGLIDDLSKATTRADNFGVEAKCGQGAMATKAEIWQDPKIPASGALGAVGGGGNPVEAQKSNCARVVMAENLRHNELIKAANRIKQRNDALKKMSESSSSMTEQGHVSAEMVNLQMFIADSQVEIQYSQALVAAYDSQIQKLTQANDMQAKQALDGSRDASLMGTVVGTAIRFGSLCTALSIAKSSASDFNCGQAPGMIF
jgi:hypothetical protein